MDRRNLEELFQAREELTARMKSILGRYRELHKELQRADSELEQVANDVEGATEEDKDVLLSEAAEIRHRLEAYGDERKELNTEIENIDKEVSALGEQTGPAREALRTAAIETEKMFFEVFKLVATLAVGAVVAISAVTPALFPKLDSLEGLWPAYAWLLTSLASSVVACALLALSIGMTLNPLRSGRRGWLRSKLPERASLLIIAIGYALLVGLPLASLLIGLSQFTLFVIKGLG